jgi:GT2 family glycosyltransferase
LRARLSCEIFKRQGKGAGLEIKNTVDISIIIVGWNSKEYLLECLHSLARESTSLESEIIVIDNGSTDGSVTAVREKFPHVDLLVSSTNLGFAKANNLGIGRSRGRYLCLMNPDVKVLPGCIDRMFSYMENHPSIGILSPQILNSDMTLQISWRRLPSVWNGICRALALDTALCRLRTRKRLHADKIRPVEVLSGCFWMVRREAVQEVGLLDEAFFVYAEDIDWCKRFGEKGWDLVYFPRSQAIHYGGTSSARAPIQSYIQMQKANRQYWQKHHGLFSRLGFSLILLLHHVLRLAAHGLLHLLIPSERNVRAYKVQRNWVCLRWMTCGKLHT